MNQVDINAGVHQLPADCYPPTDSDDESFVVLERCSGRESVYEANEAKPELLSSADVERSIEHASEALTNLTKSTLSSVPSMPSVANVFSTSGYAISIANFSNVSAELTHEEIQEKVDLLIDENVKLKETLHQNNLAMKNQFEKLLQWQADVEKVHESHKTKFAETKIYIKELQTEKTALKNALEIYKHDHDEMRKSLTEKAQSWIELGKLSGENISAFDSDNKIKNLEKQIEQIKLENGKEIDRLTQINNEQQNELKKLQEQIIEKDKLNEEWQNKLNDEAGEAKIKYMEEIGQLKMANDKLKSISTNTEEIDILRRQLMAAQVYITDLKEGKKAVETEATANRQKIDELEKLVSALTTDKDRVIALDEQLTVYKTDFEAEKASKDSIIMEKNKLAEDMHHIQRRNEQLLMEIEKLRETATFVDVSMTSAASALSTTIDPPTSPPSPPPTVYQCPICTWTYRSLHLLEEHVEQCLTQL